MLIRLKVLICILVRIVINDDDNYYLMLIMMKIMMILIMMIIMMMIISIRIGTNDDVDYAYLTSCCHSSSPSSSHVKIGFSDDPNNDEYFSYP